MGVHHLSHRQLASRDVALASDGLSILWPEALGASSDQYPAACRERRVAFPFPERADVGAMAERERGGSFCMASGPCGIGGLDCRTQGCLERAIFLFDAAGL